MSTHALSFKNITDLLKYIDEQDVRYVDLNFTDLCGGWHHITQHTDLFDKDIIEKGIYFDASSIKGWREIHESDMGLKPDLTRITDDPFAAQKTIKVFCDVFDPTSNAPYPRDPRRIAKNAEKYLKKSGLADQAFFGPEIEFFVFDDVRIHADMNHMSYQIDSEEGPYNSGKEYQTGNMGYRPGLKGGYMTDAPIDSLSDIRSEMLTVIQSMGVPVIKHHHEVAASQHELGIQHTSLLNCADNVQIYKHAVRNVANSYGKTATFMPKPVLSDNGSGMHMHQSLWKAGKPIFAGNSYAGLSEDALYYIGGIMKHARVLNAFTNPTTNSYKRLVPGFEAPVLLAYSSANRSAACRIPYGDTPKTKRLEVRFPDPTANPYLAFSAMLMAGLDGVENKIHPGEAIESNLYTLEQEEKDKITHICTSLKEALHELSHKHEFLLKGDVFTKDMIEAYIALKEEEIKTIEQTPNPAEFSLYYTS